MSFITELKRRKVLRAAFAYTVVAWLLLQVTDVVIPIFDSPNWIAQLIFFLLLSGLPIMLVLAWMFDLTNFDIIREKSPVKSPPQDGSRSGGVLTNERLSHCLACFWTAFLGVGLSFGAAAVIHLHESRQIEHELELLANTVKKDIDHAIHSVGDGLEVLRILFRAGQMPDYETFRVVSESLRSKHEHLKAIEWAPRVRAEELQSFVTRMEATYPGYLIKSFDSDGNEESIPTKAQFYPVSFTIPEVGNESAIGYDLSSETGRASSLRQAMLDAQIRQSPAVTLVQSGSSGMLLFNPVYETAMHPVSQQARQEKLRGFVLGVIDIRVLFEAVLKSNFIAAGFKGAVSVVENENPNLEPFMRIDYSDGEALSERPSMVYTRGEFGQVWLISLLPTKDYLKKQHSRDHLVIGIIGVTLSMLLATLINLILKRRKEPAQHDTPALGKIISDRSEEEYSRLRHT